MSRPSRHSTPIRRTPCLCERANLITTALELGFLLSLTFLTAPARADSPFEGRYQGRGEGRLDLQVLDLGDGSGTHFVVANTAMLNECTGELRGLAKPGGPGALVLTRKESGSEEVCTLSLSFNPDRKRVQIEEQGCGDFHGTSCAFDGVLTRR